MELQEVETEFEGGVKGKGATECGGGVNGNVTID
jgi:hypothetical protein